MVQTVYTFHNQKCKCWWHHFFPGNPAVFLYPDMATVLVGEFANGLMKRAKPSRIIAERCKDGMKQIRWKSPKGNAPIFKFQRPTPFNIGDQPQVPDPIQVKNVYIADGKMQDGAFAKRDLKKGDLVLYYSGIIYNSTLYNEMVGYHNSSAYERCSIKVSCTTTTVRSLSETSKRTAYMQVLFDVSERERTVIWYPFFYLKICCTSKQNICFNGSWWHQIDFECARAILEHYKLQSYPWTQTEPRLQTQYCLQVRLQWNSIRESVCKKYFRT